MKITKITTRLVTLMMLLTSSMLFIQCEKEETVVLSAKEKEMLLQMREEEKLARDVYDYLYTVHDLRIFDNISNSEQKHMDRILDLLNEFDIEDPVKPNLGEFSNETLQALYDQLISQGEASLEEALKVGATIEDLDIFDLDEFSKETQNAAILDTFDKLNCGSRNHMRGFNSQLTDLGIEYAVQFITQVDFLEIIEDSNEHCGN